jgi:DNA-binding ferritin-like protein
MVSNNALDEILDEVAERIRTLGHYAPATQKGYLKLTQLNETSRGANDSSGFIKNCLPTMKVSSYGYEITLTTLPKRVRILG